MSAGNQLQCLLQDADVDFLFRETPLLGNFEIEPL